MGRALATIRFPALRPRRWLVPANPSHVRVPVTGGELTVAVWGDLAAGAPVLAVHGITASSMAWVEVARRLGGPVVAPDLRGRGGSGTLPGPFGMVAHAEDCVAALDALGIERATVVGHSMGGFVAAVLTHRRPDRVRKLVLVDGGPPLPAPDGDPDEALGPAARRLRMRFPTKEAYRDFWRAHPAFADWSPAIEAYVDYDLTGEGDQLRSKVSEEAMRTDFVDLHTGAAARAAFAALPANTPFLRAERGMFDQPTPLYPDPDQLAGLALKTVPGTNHYTILFGDPGVTAVVAELS
ncbi:MAG: alpha/beta fold hydrolase [Actinophytocola sp.]|uniref:alpha/beta fold hydrolase n=1 Tax=Actinophytocola sp. TaxID=1872138 RepID=UPI0013247878|nr:alpha/beta fold hydrolase [Actinophytocola sp.]MPZ82612.1 alpha/beta fold hydrolase [Actinophytocola sp.]